AYAARVRAIGARVMNMTNRSAALFAPMDSMSCMPKAEPAWTRARPVSPPRWIGKGMATPNHHRARGARGVLPARLGAFVLAILYCAAWSPATGQEHRRRIYFLESLSPTQPAAVRTIEAFRRRLGERTTERFDIFIDYMELERFPGQAHIDRTVRYLQGKYAAAPPAVLIPLGRAAVPFMLRYRKLIAADAPVIMTSVPARAA